MFDSPLSERWEPSIVHNPPQNGNRNPWDGQGRLMVYNGRAIVPFNDPLTSIPSSVKPLPSCVSSGELNKIVDVVIDNTTHSRDITSLGSLINKDRSEILAKLGVEKNVTNLPNRVIHTFTQGENNYYHFRDLYGFFTFAGPAPGALDTPAPAGQINPDIDDCLDLANSARSRG